MRVRCLVVSLASSWRHRTLAVGAMLVLFAAPGTGARADGAFTLQEGECMGACGDAPVMLVNNKRMMSWMSDEKIDGLLAELAAQPQPPTA